MALIRVITNPDAAGYGVNIRDVPPPAQAERLGANRVGIVGAFPWGPTDDNVYEVRSVEEFRRLFAPSEFDVSTADYPSLGMLAASIPTPWFVRNVARVGAVKANSAFLDAGSNPVVTVTAKHAGAAGDQIEASIAAGSAGRWTITIRVGTAYRAVYTDVIGTGTAPEYPVDDPFVDFGWLGGTPVASTTALTNGDDGSTTSTQWAGSAGTTGGVKAFLTDDVTLDILFGAGVPAAVVPAFNLAADEVAREKLAFHFGATVSGQDRAAMLASAAALASDFTSYHGAEVVVNDPLGSGQITTDANAFACSVAARRDVADSIGANFGRDALRPVVRVAVDLNRGDYDALFEGGVCAPRMVGGAIFNGSRTTAPGVAVRQIARRRLANYIEKNAAAILERQVEQPLDVDLTRRQLGGYSRDVYMELISFLTAMRDGAPGEPSRIAGFAVDAFAATQAQLNAGIWPITVSVRTFASTEKIIINAAVGPTVTIQEG